MKSSRSHIDKRIAEVNLNVRLCAKRAITKESRAERSVPNEEDIEECCVNLFIAPVFRNEGKEDFEVETLR